MKYRQLLLLTFNIGLVAVSNAQDYVDLAKFYYAISPNNQFENASEKSTIEEIGVDITTPIKLSSKNIILTGFFYENVNVKLNPLTEKTNITHVGLKLGVNQKYSEQWSGTYLFLPKISSGLENLNSDDFQFGGLILMKYTKKPSLKYNLGLYYNQDLFGPFFVPLIGLYYKSNNNKFEVNMTLPIWADINYQLNPWLNIGSNFSAFVKSYHINTDNSYLVKKTNEVFSYLQFKIKKNFMLQTKLGYSIGRSYKLYNKEDKVDIGISAFRFGDSRTQLNTIFRDGAIFKVRLLYRFYIQ